MVGKAGGNAAAQSEAISRLISLALRAGIEPREIIKQLKGILGPMPVWDNGTQVLSTPDAIAKVMERYIEEREKGEEVVPAKAKFAKPKAAPSNPKTDSVEPKTMTACPECGSNVEHVSGCVLCYSCGWSRC